MQEHILHTIRTEQLRRTLAASAAPRIVKPDYDHVDTTEKMQKRLSAISTPLRRSLADAPGFLHDADKFLGLAVLHGYPTPAGDRMSVLHHANMLLECWKRLAPDLFVAPRHARSQTPTVEQALDAIRAPLGAFVAERPRILTDGFGFFRACVRLGYDGPGAHHAANAPNDLNCAVGKRLVAAWNRMTSN